MSIHLIDPGYFDGPTYAGVIQKFGLGGTALPSNGHGVAFASTGSADISGGVILCHVHTGDVIGYYAGTGVSGTFTVLSVTGTDINSSVQTFNATTDYIFPNDHNLSLTLPTSDIEIEKSGYINNVIGQNFTIYKAGEIFVPGDVGIFRNPDESTGTIIVNTVTLWLVQYGLTIYEINAVNDISTLQAGSVFYIPLSGGGGSGGGRGLTQLLAQRSTLRLSQ